MRKTTYRYNTLTCQYERVKLTARGVVWYALGVTVTAGLMLTGILFLHDWLVNTANENRLRKENMALSRHHAILSSELNQLQPVLTSLQNKDRKLHQRFFGSAPDGEKQELGRASKEKLLLADPAIFRQQVAAMKEASAGLISRSAVTNSLYGNALRTSHETVEKLNALPTLQPIVPWQSDRLISGFGLRVNPFHKGLYDHLGVDIAMPRGTPVVATGPGTIVQLKRSDLQAGYGNYVEVDHGHGVITRYAHLEEIHVKFGARVKKGEAIGSVGTSGGSVAPHVHYEVVREGKNVDPVLYMVEGLSSEEHHQLKAMSHRQNQSLD